MQTLARSDRVRLDKWLWAARFFKSRSLASDEIAKGRVSVNGQVVKAARELRPGDEVELRQGRTPRTVRVLTLSDKRGPADIAQSLYEETPDSLALRAELSAKRQLGIEPAQAIEQGRPTKRDRRRLTDWNRWSVAADPE
jgi:ribosome-associated heat shock protein Hsp15